MRQQPGQKLDWEDLAWDHGFKGDDEEMLFQMYNVHKLTMTEIGEKIEVCATTISRRMRDLGMKIEPRKNPNCGRGPRLPGRRKG